VVRKACHYDELTKEIGKVDGVVGAATAFGAGNGYQFDGVRSGTGQGDLSELEEQVSQLRSTIKRGQLDDLKGNSIVIGKELSDKLGVGIGDELLVMSPAVTAGPAGPEHLELGFVVVAIYSIGLYEYDSHLVYVPFEKATTLVGAGPVATSIEVKLETLTDLRKSETPS
jgi:lipoprotein-releasing system permease protein